MAQRTLVQPLHFQTIPLPPAVVMPTYNHHHYPSGCSNNTQLSGLGLTNHLRFLEREIGVLRRDCTRILDTASRCKETNENTLSKVCYAERALLAWVREASSKKDDHVQEEVAKTRELYINTQTKIQNYIGNLFAAQRRDIDDKLKLYQSDIAAQIPLVIAEMRPVRDALAQDTSVGSKCCVLTGARQTQETHTDIRAIVLADIREMFEIQQNNLENQLRRLQSNILAQLVQGQSIASQETESAATNLATPTASIKASSESPCRNRKINLSKGRSRKKSVFLSNAVLVLELTLRTVHQGTIRKEGPAETASNKLLHPIAQERDEQYVRN